MPARLFSRIPTIRKPKKTLFRASKALLLSGILFLLVFGNVLPAFAQAINPTQSDSTYNVYKYLFGDYTQSYVGTDGFTVSKNGTYGNANMFKYATPLVNKEKNTIDGMWLKLRINLALDSAKKTWDHVGAPNTKGDQFVIRNCDAESGRLDASGNVQEKYCVYQTVLYTKASTFKSSGVVSFLSTLFSPLVAAEYDQAEKAGTAAFNQSFSIFTNDINGHPVINENIDILAGGGNGFVWKQKNPDGTFTPIAFNFGLNTKRSVSLWYCGAKSGNDADPTNAATSRPDGTSPDPLNIINLGDSSCGGRSYFRFTPEILVQMPSSVQTAADQAAGVTLEDSSKDVKTSPLPACDIMNGYRLINNSSDSRAERGSFIGCIAQVFYYGIYTPIQWFAGIMGKVFDFFLGYSLDDASYRADFVVTAWKVIRDISNIFFIIILVWTGLAAVFDIGKVSMKSVIPTLIINALIINFSLFATRVAVDVSNIVARVFYNSVQIQRESNGQQLNATGPGGYKPLSVKILSSFDPQRIFAIKNASIDELPSAAKVDANGQQSTSDSFKGTNARGTTTYAVYFIIVSAIAAAIMFAMAAMFWKSAFFFLGRVIGIYVVMIFSPFAFLTRGKMPIIGGIDHLKWDDWASELTKYSLLAPIFVFFLYIIYILASSPFLESVRTSIEKGGGILSVIISIAIPMLIIYYMISVGVKIAERYAGEAGGVVQKYISGAANVVGGAVTGTAIGVATGGLGLVGRGIGAAAQGVKNNTGVGNWINRNQTKSSLAGWVARRGNAALERTQKASFDPRQSKLFSTGLAALGSKTGMKINTETGIVKGLRLDKEKTEGGIAKYQERKNKETKEEIEKVTTNFKTEAEAKEYYRKLLEKERAEELKDLNKKRNNNNYLRAEGEKELREKAEKEGKAFVYNDAAVTAAAKKKQEAMDKRIEKIGDAEKGFENFKNEKAANYGNVKDNATLQTAMRLRYAQSLADDKTSVWNTLRIIPGIAGLTGDLDRHTDATAAAAEKYMKDTRKSFKSTEKAAKELESIDKTLTGILTEVHKSNSDKYGGFRNQKGDLDSKEMDNESLHDMIEERQQHLRDELDKSEDQFDAVKEKFNNPRNAKIDAAQADYDDAIKAGNVTAAEAHSARLETLKEEERAKHQEDYQNLRKEVNKKKQEIDELKTILKRKADAEQKTGKKDDQGKGEKSKGKEKGSDEKE